MEDLSSAIHCHQPLVVGAAGDHRVLDASIGEADCDLIELRLDSLGFGAEVQEFAEKNKATHPMLLTTRHPDEGGNRNLSAPDRAAAYSALLDQGALIDIELQSLQDLASTWNEAGERGLLRIASWHNFSSCPGKEELKTTIGKMQDAGADIAKCAFFLQKPADLQLIADALESAPLPLSLMGMGPLAPASRLLAAQLGSVLNYGYLGEEPTAPGQWPARLLKEAILRSRTT